MQGTRKQGYYPGLEDAYPSSHHGREQDIMRRRQYGGGASRGGGGDTRGQCTCHHYRPAAASMSDRPTSTTTETLAACAASDDISPSTQHRSPDMRDCFHPRIRTKGKGPRNAVIGVPFGNSQRHASTPKCFAATGGAGGTLQASEGEVASAGAHCVSGEHAACTDSKKPGLCTSRRDCTEANLTDKQRQSIDRSRNSTRGRSNAAPAVNIAAREKRAALPEFCLRAHSTTGDCAPTRSPPRTTAQPKNCRETQRRGEGGD